MSAGAVMTTEDYDFKDWQHAVTFPDGTVGIVRDVTDLFLRAERFPDGIYNIRPVPFTEAGTEWAYAGSLGLEVPELDCFQARLDWLLYSEALDAQQHGLHVVAQSLWATPLQALELSPDPESIEFTKSLIGFCEGHGEKPSTSGRW
jgi:hypothetical protein